MLLCAGDGTLGAPTDFGAGAARLYSVVTGEFNGDGTIDIATVSNGGGVAEIVDGKGDGTFADPTDYTVGSKAVAVSASTIGVLVSNFQDGTLTLIADGTTTTIDTAGAPYDAVAADFNADGQIDLAIAASSANSVDILPGVR